MTRAGQRRSRVFVQGSATPRVDAQTACTTAFLAHATADGIEALAFTGAVFGTITVLVAAHAVAC